MPEGPEVETEKLHEAIKDELEHESGRFLKQIALTTAVFAAVAAIGSLHAGATVNQALVLLSSAELAPRADESVHLSEPSAAREGACATSGGRPAD